MRERIERPRARLGRLGRHLPRPLRPAAPAATRRSSGSTAASRSTTRPTASGPSRRRWSGSTSTALGVTPERVDAAISRAKNDLVTPEMLAARGDADHVAAVVAKVYAAYQERLRELVGRRFRRPARPHRHDPQGTPGRPRATSTPGSATSWSTSTRTRTSPSTPSSGPSRSTTRNLCVTGDPDQSIYGWRGANLNNILEFEHDYPGCKVVKLERNYRSTKNILRVADHLIRSQPQAQAEVADDREPRRAAGRADGLRRPRPTRPDGVAAKIVELVREGEYAFRRRRRLLPGDGPDARTSSRPSGRRRSPTRSSAACRSTSGRRSRTSWPT